MAASISVSQVLPGVHRVRKPRADGGVTEFWYAWRGGPQILRATASSDTLLKREVAKLMPAALTAYEAARAPGGESQFLYGLIARYLESPGFLELAERTRRDRRKMLDKARVDIGDMELVALEAKGARASLLAWRNGYRSTPKTADELLGAVSVVLKWAHDNGDIGNNPLVDMPRLYRVNRAEIIWEPQHLAALLAHAAPEFEHAVRLASLTALRESDLIRLPWNAVGENSIVWQTGKSRGRRTVVIPVTPPLKALLAEIPKRATTILASSRNRPWKLSGLAAALRRCRIDALEHAQKIHGPDAKTGLEGLRFHDLRGTAATNFLLAGLEIQDVALVLGWKPDRVREIAARYISGEAMGLAMVKRLGRNAPKTTAVNRSVNPASGARRGAGKSSMK